VDDRRSPPGQSIPWKQVLASGLRPGSIGYLNWNKVDGFGYDDLDIKH
jgi:hypothetical protein